MTVMSGPYEKYPCSPTVKRIAEEAKRKEEEAKPNGLIYLKFSERERKIIDELTRLNKENK